MGRLIVVSHPEVVVDPAIEITDWGLSDIGRGRAETFAVSKVLSQVSAIWSSAERKAVETADILARPRAISPIILDDLGENDRTATGFLPPAQFEAAADAFFAQPDISFKGWETAHAAQTRIVSAVTSILQKHKQDDLAIVTHGAVGTLLWCHLAGRQINRSFDQPAQGSYWCADLKTLQPESQWRPIA